MNRVHCGVLVDDVARVLGAERSIPLHHVRRHPDGIACLHRVPALRPQRQGFSTLVLDHNDMFGTPCDCGLQGVRQTQHLGPKVPNGLQWGSHVRLQS